MSGWGKCHTTCHMSSHNLKCLGITTIFYTQSPHFQRLKCNWTNKYNHKLYLVGNPLQAMTALSLDLVDISRDWVSFFVMLSQVFTADDFRCCWFVGLSVLSFVFSEWNAAQSGWDQETDRISHFFTFKNSWVAFAVCYVYLSNLYYNASWIPVHFSILFIFYSVFHSSFYSSGCFCLLFCLIIIIIITKPQ